jgi:Domain of unknown function (DUF4346)
MYLYLSLCIPHRSGKTAKDISVQLLEREQPPPVSHLEHANYLGELCLAAVVHFE